MKRIGMVVITLLFILSIIYGCEEDSQSVEETGVRVSFSNCLSFVIWVFVDGEYQGIASTEEPKFFAIPSGGHTLYARSNAVIRETNEYFCWTRNFSVADGNITFLGLDCTGAECSDTTFANPAD